MSKKSCNTIQNFIISSVKLARTFLYINMCRDGAAPCEKTISEGVFEQGLHAEVHGTCLSIHLCVPYALIFELDSILHYILLYACYVFCTFCITKRKNKRER
jgi:hypothetical protein